MGILSSLAASISRQATGSDDDFQRALLDNVQDVNKFLDSDSTACPGCPDNPLSSPSPEQDKAWKDAFKLKTFAGQATKHHVSELGRHIKRGKRKNGNPISQGDAERTAQIVVQTCKSQSQKDTCDALLESRGQN